MASQKQTIVRDKVINAFDDSGVYYHVFTTEISGIDNLGILSLLAGAAKIAGDIQVQTLAENWVNTCIGISKDCRNFDVVPHGGWDKSGQYYWRRKPQALAGPLAHEWARAQGCNFDAVWNVSFNAWLMRLVPGWAVHYVGFLRQHLNTCMLSYLYAGRRPGDSWKWAMDGNAFYSYIGGIKMDVCAFPIYKCGQSEVMKSIVPIQQREGSQWIWKQWPTKKCIVPDISYEYTPTALLIAHYLQDSHKKTS